NTVVKLFSAHGSWGLAPARVGRCQATEKTFKRISLKGFFISFFISKITNPLFNINTSYLQKKENRNPVSIMIKSSIKC
ncbi:hypothetical protein, partial [Gracilibacillus oryzae]|uniref:hypothetical protein n=1 Tax=Gracilibacillus oryzae TaxID=1672701 RepID=UPI001D191E88